MTKCLYVIRQLRVYSSWGVFPDERAGFSVSSRPVFVRCHCPEDKAVHNTYNL